MICWSNNTRLNWFDPFRYIWINWRQSRSFGSGGSVGWTWPGLARLAWINIAICPVRGQIYWKMFSFCWVHISWNILWVGLLTVEITVDPIRPKGSLWNFSGQNGWQTIPFESPNTINTLKNKRIGILPRWVPTGDIWVWYVADSRPAWRSLDSVGTFSPTPVGTLTLFSDDGEDFIDLGECETECGDWGIVVNRGGSAVWPSI